MGRPWFLIVLTLLLACSCAGSRASRLGCLEGVVLDDSTSAPLRFAAVTLSRVGHDAYLDDANDVFWGGTHSFGVGRSGKFIVADVPPGRYVVRGSYVGYFEETLPVSVAHGRRTEVLMRLKRLGRQDHTVR